MILNLRRMSLLGRTELDFRSWARSLRISAKILLICLAGLFLSWLVLRVLATPADKNIFLAIYNAGCDKTVASLAWAIATVGSEIWMPLVFWLYVFRNNRYGWTSAVLFAVSIILSMVLVDLLKALFGLSRPPQVFGPPVEYCVASPTNAAFPSGHTSRAFTVATVIWTRYPKWKVPFLALALATGLSMIIIGYHFPSDVLGGAFTGIAIGTFTVNLSRVRSDRETVTS